MNIIFITQTVAVLVSATVVLWAASVAIIREHTIVPFLPLVALAVSLCGIATLFFYGLLPPMTLAIFSASLVLTHMWILMAIVHCLRKGI
jgi:hypothetical protein